MHSVAANAAQKSAQFIVIAVLRASKIVTLHAYRLRHTRPDPLDLQRHPVSTHTADSGFDNKGRHHDRVHL